MSGTTATGRGAASLSGGRILVGIGWFLGMWLFFSVLPAEASEALVPVIMAAAFVWTAIKAPPIAIAILLYVSMVRGGWFILAAAPVSVLLARRYQRMRLGLPSSHEHVRRSVLVAAVGLLLTLPFVDSAFGPWSDRASSAARSADPLFEPRQRGDGGESALERFVRWLGFGDDGDPVRPGEFEPVPPGVRPEPEDDPFNWWPLLLVMAVLALAALVWWLWRRRRPSGAAGGWSVAADPLARLEAVGAQVGRPRQRHEGAITYGRALAKSTGDARLAETGPLVSGAVYQSAFADPRRVDDNLRGIEATPPPPPAAPPIRERLANRITGLRMQASVVFASLAAVALTIVIVLVIVPRLGAL